MRRLSHLTVSLPVVACAFLALCTPAAADPAIQFAPGLATGASATDDSSLLTRDWVLGTGTKGPYYLRFRSISPVGVVVRRGDERQPRESFRIDPGEGAVHFTEPLPSGTQVTVEYFRLPGRSQPNVRANNVAQEAPIGSFLNGDLNAILRLTTDPNNQKNNYLQSGMQLTRGEGRFGLDALVLFSQATDPTAPFRTDLQRLTTGAGSPPSSGDSTVLKLAADGDLGFAKLAASYSSAGAKFAGAQQVGLKPGEDNLRFDLTPALSGPFSMSAGFHDWAKPAEDHSKRTLTYDFGLAFDHMPRLTAKRTSLTETQRDRETDVVTDLLRMDYTLAGVTMQAFRETTETTRPDGASREQVKDHLTLQTRLGPASLQAVTEEVRQGEEAGRRTTTLNLTSPIGRSLNLQATSLERTGPETASHLQFDLSWKAGRLGDLTATWLSAEAAGRQQEVTGLALTTQPLKGLKLTGRLQHREGDGLTQTTAAGTEVLPSVSVQEVDAAWTLSNRLQVAHAQHLNPLDKNGRPQLGDSTFSALNWQVTNRTRLTIERYQNPLDKERRLQEGEGGRERLDWSFGKNWSLSLEHTVRPFDDKRRMQAYEETALRLRLPLGRYDVTAGFSERTDLPSRRRTLTGQLRVDGPIGSHARGYIGAEFGIMGDGTHEEAFDYLLRFGLTSQIDSKDWYLDLSGVVRTTEGSDVLLGQPKTRYSLTANYRW